MLNGQLDNLLDLLQKGQAIGYNVPLVVELVLRRKAKLERSRTTATPQHRHAYVIALSHLKLLVKTAYHVVTGVRDLDERGVKYALHYNDKVFGLALRARLTFSTFIKLTSGSTLVGKMRWSMYESLRSATRVPGVQRLISMSCDQRKHRKHRNDEYRYAEGHTLSISETYLPSWPHFTRTLVFPIAFTTSPTFDPGSCSNCSSSRSCLTATQKGTRGETSANSSRGSLHAILKLKRTSCVQCISLS